MKNIFIIFSLLSLILLSCNKTKRTISFQETCNLSLSFPSTFLPISTPLEMVKYQNYLLISDYKGDSLLYIFNLQNQKISKALPKGLAENQFQSPIQIKIMDSNVVFINNRWHNSAGKYIIDTNNLTFNLLNTRIHVHEDIDRLYPVSDSIYIASGRFKNGRYALVDNKGEILSFHGTYPAFQKGEDTLANFPKFMFHQTMFGYNAQKKLLACVTAHTLDILDLTNLYHPLLKRRILLSPYQYTYSQGNGWASAEAINNTETGITEISVNTEKIYMLYSANIPRNKQKMKKVKEIWSFDWEGTPLQCILPDKEISKICVDEKDNILFCILNTSPLKLTHINLKEIQ